MKMNIKKVATVLGSALMLGSTVALAAAASYPAPFVQNGAANVAIVVGGNAALSDGLAAAAIGADLASDLAAQTATGATTTSGSTVTGGDSVLIKSGTDSLNLGDELDIVGTINDEDMENFLKSGEYKDLNKNKFTYDQEISVASTSLQFSKSTAYEDKTPTIGLFYEKDDPVLNYSIDFSGLNFTNTIGTDLPLMGNMYYVLDHDSSGMTLLDNSASATLSEGETTTLTVNGKSYEVALDFVGDGSPDYAKFTVNGESMDKIAEDADDELSDGAYVAVKEVLYSSKESGVSKVDFTIGTGKLYLPLSGEVEMNDDRVVNVDSSISNGVIDLVWHTDAKTVLTKSEDELVLPGFKTIKISYAGMPFPEAEKTVLDAAGVIELETSVKDGPVTISLVNAENVSATGLVSYVGEDTDSRLILGSANSTASVVQLGQIGDYFVATYGVAGDDNYESYVYQLDSIKLDSDNKTEVILDNLASTENTDDITFADINRTRTKGELTFTLNGASETTEDVNITITGGNAVSTRKLVTKEGLSIDLSNLANVSAANFTSGVNLTFKETDEDNNFESGRSFTTTLKQSSDGDNIQVDSTNVTKLETKTADVWIGYVDSELATRIDFDVSDTDNQDFSISYNGEEVKAEVYVAASAATISAGSGSTGSATQLGAITIKDSEVSSVSGKNLIVIGGSAVNSVAASLLGGAAGGDSFTAATGIKAGEALIKSFDRSGKVALLVAGYNAEDTTKAATYLTNNAVNTTVGDKGMKVTSATTATAITA